MLTKEGMTKLREWLGQDGLECFRDYKKKYGTVSPVFTDVSTELNIPHSVHFREGMFVRNFLRSLPECKDWDSHKLDDSWVKIIEEAISVP